jgi:hypothetical protein
MIWINLRKRRPAQALGALLHIRSASLSPGRGGRNRAIINLVQSIELSPLVNARSFVRAEIRKGSLLSPAAHARFACARRLTYEECRSRSNPRLDRGAEMAVSGRAPD